MNPNVNNTYTIEKNGPIAAIRIYLTEGRQPTADLAFTYGGAAFGVRWDSIMERQKYAVGINAYTVYRDERFPKREFYDFLKDPADETDVDVDVPST